MSSQEKKLSSCRSRVVHHLPGLGRVRPELMADQVIGGKADDEHVGHRMAAELLTGDQSAREIELVGVPSGSGSHRFIKGTGTRVVGFLLGLRSAVAGIKGCYPIRQRVHVVAGSDEGARGRFDPIGAIGRIAGRQNGSSILERDAEDLRLACRRQAQRIADGGGAKIERRGARLLARMDRAQDAVAIVLDRGNRASLVAG